MNSFWICEHNRQQLVKVTGSLGKFVNTARHLWMWLMFTHRSRCLQSVNVSRCLWTSPGVYERVQVFMNKPRSLRSYAGVLVFVASSSRFCNWSCPVLGLSSSSRLYITHNAPVQFDVDRQRGTVMMTTCLTFPHSPVGMTMMTSMEPSWRRWGQRSPPEVTTRGHHRWWHGHPLDSSGHYGRSSLMLGLL